MKFSGEQNQKLDVRSTINFQRLLVGRVSPIEFLNIPNNDFAKVGAEPIPDDGTLGRGIICFNTMNGNAAQCWIVGIT